MRTAPSLLGSVAALALAVAVPREAHAEEAAAAGAEPDEVVVKGEGGQARGFTSTARLEDAPREITDAASLIEPLPGVHVRRLGADDSFATLSIRGTSSTQVAVYLAGVPLSGGADPTLDLATLPLWPGARARVYRSFAPAALGRGSLGGTLVLEAPSPRAPAATDVWAAAGSFGSRRLRVGDVRGEPDGVRVATGLSASRSDDDFAYLDPLATAAHGSDAYATRANAGHAAASGLVSVGLPVRLGRAGAGALTLTTLAQARRQQLPGTITAPTAFQRLDSTRLVSALELTAPVAHGTFGVRGWGRREGLAVRDDPASARVANGPSRTDDAILAAGGSVGWRGRPGDAASIEARVDGSAERFAPGEHQGGAPPPGARRSSLGAALDASVRPLPAVTLAASARADAWLDTSDDGGATTDARPTGNVGVEANAGPIVVASHLGLLARPASFIERFGNRGAFLPEPSLRPESATTADVGASVTRRLGPARLHLEIAAFATWAEDLIVFVYKGAYARQKATNIGRARLAGLESEARAAAFGLDARVSYTAITTANETECGLAVGSCERPPLPQRPAHDFVADLAYAIGPVRLRSGIDVVTGTHTDLQGAPEQIVPTRVLVSAGVRLAVPGVAGLSLALDARNLLDVRVAEYDSVIPGLKTRVPIGDVFEYPLPGRSFLLSARWTSKPIRREP